MLSGFGTRLKKCRKDAGITQEELGARAGVSYKYIGEVERGIRNPSLRTISKIASALNIEVNELLCLPKGNGRTIHRSMIDRILDKRDEKTLCKVAEVLTIVFDEKPYDGS